jgi:hypothetical protein
MERNGRDEEAPASDAVLALDAPEQAARGENPAAVGDVPEPRSMARRPPSLRVVSRPRTRIGRPPHLTTALQEKLVAAVRVTGWINSAARQCGVPEPVVRECGARGRGQHVRPATRAYAAFAAAIQKAQGEWETAMLARIIAAADLKPEHWTAAAWSLERFDPQHYGRRNRVDVGGTMTLLEMRALLEAVVGLIERYLPEARQEAKLADLCAVAREIAGRQVLPPGH